MSIDATLQIENRNALHSKIHIVATNIILSVKPDGGSERNPQASVTLSPLHSRTREGPTRWGGVRRATQVRAAESCAATDVTRAFAVSTGCMIHLMGEAA